MAQTSSSTIDLDLLYCRYAPLVLRRALRFFEQSRAEEVVHEVFEKLVENPDSFRGESSPVTWLYRVTTNHCLNRIRNEGRRKELLEEHAPEIRPRRQANENAETVLLNTQLWKQLPPELVQIGVYHYIDGLTLKEIARIQGCSPRTIVNRLAELKTEVAAALGEET